MTIEFKNVMKKVRLGPVRLNYHDLNLRFEQNARIAFLGQKEAGLEAIVSLICTADAPDKGRVSRTHSISWPIPSAQFLKKHLSLAANSRFIARLYEKPEDEFVAKVSEMAQIRDHYDTRGDQAPKDAVSRFLFSLGMCLEFDQYIITSMSVGDKDARARFGEILNGKLEHAGLLLVGPDIKSAQQFCDQAYVFDEGRATYFDDMEAAAEFFGGVSGKGGGEEEFFEEDSELESLVNMDF